MVGIGERGEADKINHRVSIALVAESPQWSRRELELELDIERE